ncbi:MAG: dihydropteroate synthase [Methanosarcinales archaeon]|nr:dihydropteroate synthase [ANME-2 cluster archaeon]MDF1532181.1 dihydropteroate synthase [ANME-2 cluster archaeon]MDW7776828.1 dihydropteroate synthase [Methanosarcinales archaeon]
MAVDTEIAGIGVGDAHPVRIMGVINLSSESFYKGSVTGSEHIIETAQRMVAEGADLLDVGARSTWPLADTITKEEERRRLIPALELLVDAVEVPISVDTQFADLARESLELGAHIINDVSGLTADPTMVRVAREFGCPIVVMASEHIPGDPLGMDAIMRSLGRIIRTGEDAGIPSDNIIIDPAIGKWLPEKAPMYDFETLDQLERLKVFDKPVLIAISRKSFIGEVLGKPATERLMGSIAATAIAVYKGAHIIRTHDVADTADAVRVAQAIRGQSVSSEGSGYSIEALDVVNTEDAPGYFSWIGTTGTGSRVMKDKTVLRVLRITNVSTTEALIIKQEALSRGCDAALPRDAVSHETQNTDLIVMGTELQLKRLAVKLQGQARDLPILSGLILSTLQRFRDTDYRYG